jgi:hypothetical protein
MYRNTKNRSRWSPIWIGLLLLITSLGLATVIMLLWNNILSEVLGIPTLNLWQALGLFVLSRILFGRLGPGSSRGFPAYQNRKAAWREKWGSMSAEERAELKARWRERCGKKGEE